MKGTSIRGLKALFGYLWSYRWTTACGVLGLLVADVAQLAVPFLCQQAIDRLQSRSGPITGLVYTVLALAVLAYLARCLWRYCLFGVARRCDVQIRRAIYQRSVGLTVQYHQSHSIGQIMALATSDVTAVRMALAFALMSAFDAVAYTVLSISALIKIDPQLALITLLPFPVMGLVMKFLLQWNYITWDRVQQSLDQLTEKSRESISGMRVLRSLVQRSGDCDDFHRITEEQYRRFMRFVVIDGLYSPSIIFLAGIASALLLSVGGGYVASGRMTVGEFTAFASFLGQLSWPMVAVGWTLSLVQRGAASMERILKLLDQQPEPVQPTQPLAGAGSLRVQELTFQYPHAPQPALQNLSFEVKPGGSLGLVGEVGSGKSTLTRLLVRLYEPPQGRLWLDDRDISQLNLSQLRSQIGWVEQESFLFSASIEDNLRLGNPLASQQEVVEAARLAELHQEVMSFPQGYATLLGERGVTLSGGQKQRLCLARALLKAAPILVLDDTLSAVDADTEQRILGGLSRRKGNQTLLVISHRISAIRDLDEILVLHQGQVVQRGTHHQLLAQPGRYRELYDLQMRQETA